MREESSPLLGEGGFKVSEVLTFSLFFLLPENFGLKEKFKIFEVKPGPPVFSLNELILWDFGGLWGEYSLGGV